MVYDQIFSSCNITAYEWWLESRLYSSLESELVLKLLGLSLLSDLDSSTSFSLISSNLFICFYLILLTIYCFLNCLIKLSLINYFFFLILSDADKLFNANPFKDEWFINDSRRRSIIFWFSFLSVCFFFNWLKLPDMFAFPRRLVILATS